MINKLAAEIYSNAQNKGFYDQFYALMNHEGLNTKEKNFITLLWRSNRLMLIVSELGEALEGLRHGNLSSEPKSGGAGEELADSCIRTFDLARDMCIDLEKAISDKMTYNTTRQRMYGEAKEGGKLL